MYEIRVKYKYMYISEAEEVLLPHYKSLSSNINKLNKKQLNSRVFYGRTNVANALCRLPDTIHDPSTFTVDVLSHNVRCYC